jgi:hypothetical protein
MLVFDFQCPECNLTKENVLVDKGEAIFCTKCNTQMDRLGCAPHIFTTIVPTTNSSKSLKAGYVHQFKNTPASKIQMGYGGGLSPDHPKGK